jgi:hypothetical protein
VNGVPGRHGNQARLTAALIAAVLLSGVLGVRSPAPAAAANGACVNGWQEMTTPASVFLSTAFDIVVHKGKEAWIVGGTNTGVLALRWSGGTWKQTARAASGHRGLVGAASIGANKLLGVGYYRPYMGNGAGSLKPISGRVIVDTWKGRAVPDLPSLRATLTDVVALPGGSALAVGTRLQGGKLQATALFHNGTRWRRQDPATGTGSGLLGISRAGTGAVWAVGWKESKPGRPRAYVVRRSGNGWKPYRITGLPAGNVVLTDVHFRGGNNGVAVGYLSRDGQDSHQVILLRWDGRSWQNTNLPWAGDFDALPRSVSLGTDGTIWIGGTKTADATRETRGFIANGQGATWRVSSLGTPDDIRSEVMAVAATDTGAIAAATVGASLLALRACGENLPAALAAAGGKQGTTKRKLAVSRIAARRASQRNESRYLHEDDDTQAGGGARSFSTALDDGRVVELAAPPVRHPSFWVKDMAAASGLRQTTKTYDGFAADLDGNGWMDVFYSRHGSILPRVALNAGGTFTTAPPQAFSSVDRHGCDRGDLDGDGTLDILCAVGASRGKAMRRHELSLAPATGARILAKDALGISDPLGRGRFTGILRLDKDKYPEVFIANAPDRNDGWPGYNRFYTNVNGVLRPAPGVGLDTSHGATCVLTGDFDADGDQDIAYCTQYGFAGRRAGLRFMRNDGGKLKDLTRQLNIKQIGDIDVAFADVTGDGRQDLIQLAPDRLRVSRWTAGGYKRIYEARISDAWALAAGDASGDGRADIYVVRGNDKRNKPDRLLVSRRAGRDFASVKIPQTSAGSADDVFALDYDKNGLMDFVVLNGRTKAGPVQLLASFRRK